MNQKTDTPLLLIICMYLTLLCIEPLIKIQNQFISTHFLTCVLTIIFFMVFSNPFVQSKTEIKSIKENKNFFVRLAIALALSAIILFVRMIIPLCFILEDNLESRLTIPKFLFIMSKTFIYAMVEEMVFNYGFRKLFNEIELKKYIARPIICLSFALVHFIGRDFIVLDFFFIAVMRLMFLAIYNLYPSITLISSIHFGTNIVNAILVDIL